jgi:hypothetical protein
VRACILWNFKLFLFLFHFSLFFCLLNRCDQALQLLDERAKKNQSDDDDSILLITEVQLTKAKVRNYWPMCMACNNMLARRLRQWEASVETDISLCVCLDLPHNFHDHLIGSCELFGFSVQLLCDAKEYNEAIEITESVRQTFAVSPL